ncbi:GNAT family N-acetyltransferase [Bosea sp. (in: a-proteobacteria)]|jgi:GNAT superfamily N-acetyltransferase|uniref:GNAT family N-acetyltransferase n=1 Tax=Bosea sp. (in: a-proteobacteria) TaxID=1871050 RepID=UPI002DDCD38E|nr:GNAT family N-acetyltransferase [Bosea sp. (in: a-proteobacteria)]HEV2513286.1 GNAT family N-acetyltransferase [Bosea sp. (in: a-proteobacteria)]
MSDNADGVTIRPLEAGDRADWEQLWIGSYAHGPFGGPPPPAGVTDATFACFLGDDAMRALVAVRDDGLVGIVHAVFHPVTSSDKPVCFLNDLFVAETARRHGVGRRLIEGLYDLARAEGALRVYWHMQVDNRTAGELYDKVASRSGHTVFRRSL